MPKNFPTLHPVQEVRCTLLENPFGFQPKLIFAVMFMQTAYEFSFKQYSPLVEKFTTFVLHQFSFSGIRCGMNLHRNSKDNTFVKLACILEKQYIL